MNLVENTATYSKPQSILLASAIIFILIGLSSCGSQPEESSNWLHYGGAVVTKSGILFIAATKDSKIRAFDQDNGNLLWEAQLPYPGYATPSVYQIDGKEYLVIACGGGKLGSTSGDRYVAFSL